MSILLLIKSQQQAKAPKFAAGEAVSLSDLQSNERRHLGQETSDQKEATLEGLHPAGMLAFPMALVDGALPPLLPITYPLASLGDPKAICDQGTMTYSGFGGVMEYLDEDSSVRECQ